MIAAALTSLVLLFPNGQPAPTWQGFADKAQAPVPSGTVVIDPTGCPTGGTPGCVYLDRDPVVIHVDRRHPARRLLLLHELGHLFDRQYMTEGLRALYQQRTGNTGTWGTGEVFADDYATCARGWRKLYDGFDQCGFISWLAGR